jgi:hypothetical protein
VSAGLIDATCLERLRRRNDMWNHALGNAVQARHGLARFDRHREKNRRERRSLSK